MTSRTRYSRKAKDKALENIRGPPKTRTCWNDDLHQRFLDAIEHLGGLDRATRPTPTEVMQAMAMPNITLLQVKSHLQYYLWHKHRSHHAAEGSEGMPSNRDGSSSSEAEEEAEEVPSNIDGSSLEAEEKSKLSSPVPPSIDVSSSDAEEECEPIPPSNEDVSTFSGIQRRIEEYKEMAKQKLEQEGIDLEQEGINLEQRQRNLDQRQRRHLEHQQYLQMLDGMGSTSIRNSETSEEEEEEEEEEEDE